jgi:Protein of unknwon function (DUF3310)
MALIYPSPHLFKAGDTGIYCEYCGRAEGGTVHLSAVHERVEINHPPHYTAHPSGVECIQVTEHMGFNLGNAIKYIWRADLKGTAEDDLRKAAWYIARELKRRGYDS